MSHHSHSHSPPTMSASPAPLSPASSAGVPGAIPNHTTLAAQNMGGADPSSGPVRRKTSRRANTAERRATHNAVERQRRETLNGRFLDLAALLPNLAAVRRPSKSAIVNSSIALIHTQRRQRAFAGRELRQLKAETDALRRELNEWRDRSGAGAVLPRIEEPVRSAEFLTLMTLEDVSVAEEDEIRRAYEMASIPLGDEDEDGFVDAAPAPGPYDHLAPPQQQPQQQQPQQQVQVQHMAPHHPGHPHHGMGMGLVPQSAPAHLTHHQIAMAPPAASPSAAAALEQLLLQQQQQHQHQQQHQQSTTPPHGAKPQGPAGHIPAFDGPSMFPGPGHHAHHQRGYERYDAPQQQQVYGPQYNNPSPGVSGSPPHSAHFGGPYGPRQTPPAAQYARDGAATQFAHVPPRDDDSLSSSSGGGSPPATGHSHFGHQQQQQQAMHHQHQEVPTLAAGATPADFARFWQSTNPAAQGGPGRQVKMEMVSHMVPAGFAPMGFAM